MEILDPRLVGGTFVAQRDGQPVALIEEIYDETTGEKLSDILSRLT